MFFSLIFFTHRSRKKNQTNSRHAAGAGQLSTAMCYLYDKWCQAASFHLSGMSFISKQDRNTDSQHTDAGPTTITDPGKSKSNKSNFYLVFFFKKTPDTLL